MSALLVAGVLLLICVLSSKILYRFGIPTLIVFLAIGMLMGSEGPGGIYFDNSELAKEICNLALLFILFSGGFSTNWKTAKPVALQAGILATLGVALTALLIGFFAHFALGLTLLEGMLLGSIVSSTDAASVFSILRSNKLNLKNNLAPLLEMESGSNDPMAYMLTITFLGMLTAGSEQNFLLLLLIQFIIGAAAGIAVAKTAVWLINRIKLDIEGLYSILVISAALIAYASADLLSGNGFLAVYIAGLLMGNTKLTHKVSLVRYFDGLSWLMQILLFFTLGLLVFPSHLLDVALTGIGTAAFIIFIARPVAMFCILTFFKRPVKDQLLVSWAGFRGAASIVFAIYPLAAGIAVAEQIFNTIFFVALVSVIVQGTFFMPIAKKLNLVSTEETVLKTFTDYSGEIHAKLLDIKVNPGSIMADKTIMDLDIPSDVLIVMIKRGNKIITPRGSTVIKSGDTLMLAGEKKALLKLAAQSKRRKKELQQKEAKGKQHAALAAKNEQ